MATNVIIIDTNNQGENFLFETTEGSDPLLSVFVYTDGTAVTLTSAQTAKFIYSVDRDSSEMVEVDGTVNAGTNQIDFQFTTAKTSIHSKFFASIIVYISGDSSSIVQSDGMIILKRNPALSGATPLDTTTTINWGLITNLPPFPWLFGTDTVTVECADSPYDVSTNDQSKTHLHNVDCDFTFVLPLADATTIGRGYAFKSKKRNFTITVRAREGNTVDQGDDNAIDGGQVTSVRGHVSTAGITVQQLTATSYDVVWANGAFLTEGSQYSSSSSSSSSEQLSSSSSSSSS